MKRRGGSGSTRGSRRSRRVQSFFKNNALSIAALSLFLVSIIGQALTGFSVANDTARQHGSAGVALNQYLVSGDFVEATFENWESEFLQMALFVVLTKFLQQRGSSESKEIGKHDEVDEDPGGGANAKRRSGKYADPDAPWPVRHGGIVLALYERSLSIALFSLFVASFALHAVGGASKYNEEALRHGDALTSTLGYMTTSRFWFESFQNWQSEFLSVGALVLLSIVLRERGSSQSKPVAAPHAQTGAG